MKRPPVAGFARFDPGGFELRPPPAEQPEGEQPEQPEGGNELRNQPRLPSGPAPAFAVRWSDERLFSTMARAAAYHATKGRWVSLQAFACELQPFRQWTTRGAWRRAVRKVWKLHNRRWLSGAWRASWSAVQSERARRPSIYRLLTVELRDRQTMDLRAQGWAWADCAAHVGCAESTARMAPARLARLRAWRVGKQGAAILPGDTAHGVQRRIAYRELTAEPDLRADVAELCARVRERIAWWADDPPFPGRRWLLSGAVTAAARSAIRLWCMAHLRPGDWPPGYGGGLSAARQPGLLR